ncbi:MAG: CRISPR system precrRNA processing endoribonuclease RAMP protein Cas6 [Anaerolineae bacterium]|nr:CRISPR system precrRNA processing endoribonuclease RAMP protein Cas6 [Anaerolineae bacterium]
MDHFTAHRLWFAMRAQDNVELNEHQGSAIRGSLFHALRNRFCAFAREPDAECTSCVLAKNCPVATLVSTLDPEHRRGQDRPRPFTVQAPSPGSGHPWELDDGRVVLRYDPGETLTFGLTLYADAMQLFPYVVLALQEFEVGGLGRKCAQPDGRWRRGRLAVQRVWAQNPLSGEEQPVLREGSRQVHVPDIPVSHAQVLQAAGQHSAALAAASPDGVCTVHFLSPTRLIEAKHLVKPERFRFRPLLQRLLERLEALSEAFSNTPLDVDFPMLLEAAERVRVVENRLVWEEFRSYSTRRHGESPMSGLLGEVTLQTEDWAPFLPWLIWGQFAQVGKDAVKGNGVVQLQVSTLNAR